MGLWELPYFREWKQDQKALKSGGKKKLKSSREAQRIYINTIKLKLKAHRVMCPLFAGRVLKLKKKKKSPTFSSFSFSKFAQTHSPYGPQDLNLPSFIYTIVLYKKRSPFDSHLTNSYLFLVKHHAEIAVLVCGSFVSFSWREQWNNGTRLQQENLSTIKTSRKAARKSWS